MTTPFSADPKCPLCATKLPADAVVGLCPRCLMVGAMQPTQAGDPAGVLPAPTPQEIAAHFPQLEIIELLGRGGMGVVYKARQKTLGRLVALKLLAPERVADRQFAERFTHEAKALAALSHPNIVTIHDFGQAGGFYYLLMEFVDGVNLRQAMKAGRFTPEQALAIVPPVCAALQFAHEHGIVHRDIKPENLLLDKDGRVKIADFGISKMLGDEASLFAPEHTAGESAETDATLASVAGTPHYMAPEQKAHRRTDHRADIYSLGVVLYELLTGELPADKLQPPSRKVQIDVRLDEIVLRALEQTPELRYQTAVEFRTQVETLASTPPSASPAEPSVRTGGAQLDVISKFLIWSPIVGSRNGRRVIHWAGAPTNGILFAGWLAAFFAGAVLLGMHISGWLASISLFVLGMLIAGIIRDCRKPIEQLPSLDDTEPRKAPQGGAPRRAFAGIPIIDSHEGKAGIVWSGVVAASAAVYGIIALVAVVLWMVTSGAIPLGQTLVVDLLLTVLCVGNTVRLGLANMGSKAVGATTEDHPPRFSRLAIVGVCWGVAAILVVAMSLIQVGNPAGPIPPAQAPLMWALKSALLLIGFTAPFGTTILGWIAVSQIRRSAGKLRGLGLAVFNGLFFPLIGLDAAIWLIAGNLWKHNPPEVSHPVGRWLAEHEFVIPLFALLLCVVVDWLIIRRVWRAVTKSSASPGTAGPAIMRESDGSSLAAVATGFATLSGILGMVAWIQMPQPSQGVVWSILAAALLGLVLALPVRKNRLGKYALVLGGINTVIWLMLAVFGPHVARMSPAEARSAIEQTLKREITKKLAASSERFTSLSVALDPELKTAAVNMGGLQEMRGIEGRNVWVDIDGSLKVSNDGGDWIVQGGGTLGAIHFTVPLGDLTLMAAADANSMVPKRSRFPLGATIIRNHHSVMVQHDGVELHYVFYYAGIFGTSSSGSQDTPSGPWTDDGSITLKENERTFGYHRSSDDPTHLRVNGKEYDLTQGRVLVLDDNGTLTQRSFEISLDVARDPEALATAIANHTWGADAKEGAKSVFGPVLERTLTYARKWDGGCDVLRLSDGAVSRLPDHFFDHTEQANRDWLIAGGSKIFPGLAIFPDEPPGPHGWGFAGADVEFAFLPDDAWNNPTPERLNESLADKNAALRHWITQGATVHCLSPVAKWPATLAFRAGDGSMGLLQFLEINDTEPEQPIKIKIRYKLVRVFEIN